MSKRWILITVALVLPAAFQVGSAQNPVPGITKPEANVVRIDDVEYSHVSDGRRLHRVNGSTVGLINVHWPKGTVAEPHNHSVELIVSVASGRLKVLTGGDEFILEPGDVVAFPAWVDHGFEALEDTVTFEAAGPG